MIMNRFLLHRSFHCYLVKKATGLHLHGVMTSDESKRTKIKLEHGENVVVYANYDDVVNDPQVDLIVIATPPDSHYGFAMKALNAKKNVVIGTYTHSRTLYYMCLYRTHV